MTYRLSDLRESIEEKGVQEPIVVHEAPDGGADIVDGRHRLLALARSESEHTVPVIELEQRDNGEWEERENNTGGDV